MHVFLDNFKNKLTNSIKYVFIQGWLCCKLSYGSRKISRLENKTESWFEKGNILICYCFNRYNVWYLACPSGYFGINCFATYPYPFFGRLCTHQCNCSKSKCDFINGCKRYGRAMIIFSFFGFWFWFIFCFVFYVKYTIIDKRSWTTSHNASAKSKKFIMWSCLS